MSMEFGELPQLPRIARVYDGRDDTGRPLAIREPLPPSLRDSVLAYLASAPVVLAARSYEVDEFTPTDRDVPLTFQTDGVWIWSGSVAHYLRKHNLPPEPELVRHIVDRGFRLGEVDEGTQNLAVRIITGT